VTFMPIGPLRKLFLVVLVAIAAQMLVKGVRELDHAKPTFRTSAPATETTPTTSPSHEPIGGGPR
jgi:uncharacterized membrane protein YfcA